MRMLNKGKISIVMATYNRSKVLYYSILSVLYQTYNNWELIVVGDHCTDDTGQVVSSFNDPRIIFHNLPENFGEQSYPNNVGMKMSTGDYIAFLNHDDIWLPDHLEISMHKLIDSNSDLAFSMIGLLGIFNEKSVISYSDNGTYQHHILSPASAWLFKRIVYEKVGEWRSAWDIIQYPSEDYIYRIYKNNFKIVATNKLTMIKPVSIIKENMYLTETDINKEIYESIINNKNFREQFLTDVIVSDHGDHSLKIYLYKALRELVKRISIFIAKAFNIHPAIITNIIAFRGGKGKGINYLRKKRGLNKIRK